MPNFRSGYLVAGACALLFIGLAGVADLVTTRVFIDRNDALDAARLGRLIRDDDPKEIPIFGASKARHAYIPEILGPSFYNYSLDSASLDVVNMMLSFELKKPSTKPILIDMFQTPFEGIGDVRTYVPFANNDEIERMLRHAGVMRWYYRIFGLRFFGAYDWYFRGYLSHRLQLTQIMSRGYTRRLKPALWDSVQFGGDVKRRMAETFTMGFYDYQEKRLIELIKSAPKRQFVLLFAPLHKSFYANVKGEEAYQRQLNDFRQLKNVYILDFSRNDYPDNYFMDTAHLNPTGAAVYSKMLRERLTELGING